MQLGIRPKSDFMNTASWEQLYVITEHWQSDQEFYADEIRFMQDLISKYFMLLVKEESSARLQQLTSRMLAIDKDHRLLKIKTTRHLTHIAGLAKNSFVHDEQEFRNEHASLEDLFVKFVNDFKALKKDVFKVTEHILHNEKLKHLLGS